MIKVKVCGMTNPLNVKEIAGGSPDFLGFIFYPGSPRYIGNEDAGLLLKSVPPEIIKIGVFVNEDYRVVIDSAKQNGLGMIQLHGNEPPGYCKILSAYGLKIIKAFNLDDSFEFEAVKPFEGVSDYFLFDSKSEKPGGSGRKFNWEKLIDYSGDKQFFLGGGIGPGDADSVKELEKNGLYAVDINSRFETAPGIKNVPLVKSFISEIKKNGSWNMM
jgi:phosphoribosylanthranilate isomerase